MRFFGEEETWLGLLFCALTSVLGTGGYIVHGLMTHNGAPDYCYVMSYDKTTTVLRAHRPWSTDTVLLYVPPGADAVKVIVETTQALGCPLK